MSNFQAQRHPKKTQEKTKNAQNSQETQKKINSYYSKNLKIIEEAWNLAQKRNKHFLKTKRKNYATEIKLNQETNV